MRSDPERHRRPVALAKRCSALALAISLTLAGISRAADDIQVGADGADGIDAADPHSNGTNGGNGSPANASASGGLSNTGSASPRPYGLFSYSTAACFRPRRFA